MPVRSGGAVAEAKKHPNPPDPPPDPPPKTAHDVKRYRTLRERYPRAKADRLYGMPPPELPEPFGAPEELAPPAIDSRPPWAR
jgi:hypothetical protein